VLNKLRLKLIKILIPRKDIAMILISLGFAEEEYVRRYNNPEHAGYKSESLKHSLKDLDRLQKYFEHMLSIWK
jgi:hypothetical protein